jgi:hypothetical protein
MRLLRHDHEATGTVTANLIPHAMRKFLLCAVVFSIGFLALKHGGVSPLLTGAPGGGRRTVSVQGQDYADSGSPIQDEGVVTRVLPDDRDGSRHQKFIVRLSSGRTILIAHNIDLAPRIGGLRTGDVVAFRGVFEWNPEGGVVHWTHRDPSGRHPAGWLKHGSRTYQ